MSELHELCQFPTRPIDDEYLTKLGYYLANGIPATYTLEECANYLAGKEEEELDSTTTPLHLICRSIPTDANNDEKNVILKMIDDLFSWGAGWNLIDDDDKTPGDVLFHRGLKDSEYYTKMVDAGVRAELVLRKINDDIEFLSDEEEPVEEEQLEEQESAEQPTQEEIARMEAYEAKMEKIKKELIDDPANTQSTYLNTKLEYRDGALITKDNKDGVMMNWEYDLMKAGCDTIFKTVDQFQVGPNGFDENDFKEINVLNIGFGMGIIDTMIQAKQPTMHYICEAHPDVINKLHTDGWFEKPNVKILEGRWQDTLPELLNQGVFFNGIYYDTYSEHYSDMLDLYDLIVGLLKPSGVFSFFNGLGADRQVIYDVYKKIVEIDMTNYGMNVKYTDLNTPKTTSEEYDSQEDSEWNGIKRAYWRCKTYYHPEIKFQD
jgi:protein arginine N-methyltransferase 2